MMKSEQLMCDLFSVAYVYSKTEIMFGVKLLLGL
jgi:hypothetical protein